MKLLKEMTLEELWQLFPIVLVEHQEKWKAYYNEIESLLKDCLYGVGLSGINHIGSTAIDGIHAKPIVDVLVEISTEEDIDRVGAIISNNGFIEMSRSKGRISFNKGYTPQGFAEKVYHVHLRYKGDNDELYFRDYMNEFREVAREYEKLKLSLWKKYEHDRDGYTNAKTDFVKKYTALARERYGERY